MPPSPSGDTPSGPRPAPPRPVRRHTPNNRLRFRPGQAGERGTGSVGRIVVLGKAYRHTRTVEMEQDPVTADRVAQAGFPGLSYRCSDAAARSPRLTAGASSGRAQASGKCRGMRRRRLQADPVQNLAGADGALPRAGGDVRGRAKRVVRGPVIIAAGRWIRLGCHASTRLVLRSLGDAASGEA